MENERERVNKEIRRESGEWERESGGRERKKKEGIPWERVKKEIEWWERKENKKGKEIGECER